MANHAVVRTDKLMGTDVRSGLVSIKYVDGDGANAGAIDNGNVLKINGLVAGEREIYKGVAVAAADALKDIILIASVEVMYDAMKKDLALYENEEGKVMRGYVLHSGDVFSVTEEALAGTSPAVGQIIELAAGTKLKNVASATSGSTAIGKIIAKEIAGKYTFYVIEID